MITQKIIVLPSYGRGFHLITEFIEKNLDFPPTGLVNLFIKHTSCGLCINENADPSVRHDFNSSFDNLVKENEPFYTHTMEGPDDMPAHIKSVLTGHEVTIPITDGQLNLGTWQGIYLCEFRNQKQARKLVATVYA